MKPKFAIWIVITLVFSCKLKNAQQNKKDILSIKVDEELKTFYNLFPNLDEIEVVRMTNEIVPQIEPEYYSKEELLYFYDSEKLQNFFDSVQNFYQAQDSIRIAQQVRNGTFQKEYRNTYLSYIPSNAPDSLVNKSVLVNYIKNFKVGDNFKKIVFYPFIKNYENLESFKNRLQIELKFQLLDFFWYKILSEDHLNKVANLDLKADRTGFKIDLVWLEAQQVLKDETGEGLYIETSKRYNEIVDSLNKINRFDNSYFVKNQIHWIKVHDSHIYVSPFLIRSAYLKSLLTYGKSFYDLAISDNIKFSYYADMVLPEVKEVSMVSSNLIVDLATFKRDFYASFSFILGHELAHTYLGNKSLLFQNEIVCDCYSLVYMNSYKSQVDIFNEINQNNYDFELGIYEDFMRQSVIRGLGGIWGMNDTIAFNAFLERHKYMSKLTEENKFEICDEILKKK